MVMVVPVVREKNRRQSQTDEIFWVYKYENFKRGCLKSDVSSLRGSSYALSALLYNGLYIRQ